MAVDIKGRGGLGMSKLRLYILDILPLVNQNAGKSVSQGLKMQPGNAGLLNGGQRGPIVKSARIDKVAVTNP